MFSRIEKADYSTPGFKWKPLKNKQGIKGKIYTAWPLSLITRFWPAMGIGFLIGAMTTGGALGGMFMWMLFAYGICLIWPFNPFARSIKITPDYLAIGGKHYDTEEIRQFHVVQKSASTNFPSWMVVFEYGRKTIKIKNAHKEKEAYRIAEQLHQFIEEARGAQTENVQEQVTTKQYETPEQARAAAF